jgi:hypothetical protein
LDREETIWTLRKNKLDMEHQALLQDREMILIAETGFPITMINVVVTAQWYTYPLIVSIVAISGAIIGAIEWGRRRKNREIIQKRQEIDHFIAELAP